MRLGCDASNYTAVPTDEQVRELLDLGITFAVVGTSWGASSPAQLDAFGRNGMDVAEYQFPNALRATVRPWWVDCETDNATLDRVRNALRIGACGVYSRRGWWASNLPGFGAKAEFPATKLWDARYVHGDGPCRIQFAIENNGDVAEAIASELMWLPAFVPYGGFTEAHITQWHDSVTIAGLNLDLNVMEEDRVYSDKEVDDKIGAVLAAVVDGNKKVEAVDGAVKFLIDVTLNLAGQVYGDADPKTLDLKQRVDALEAGK